jgi:DNA helicase HerA-like ATPase
LTDFVFFFWILTDELDLLYEDSEELENWFKEAQEEIFAVKKTQPGSMKQSLDTMIEFFKTEKADIAILKQMKLFELGGLQPKHYKYEYAADLLEELPEIKDQIEGLTSQIYPLIIESVNPWKEFARSLLNSIKDKIPFYQENYLSLFNNSSAHINSDVMICLLKMVDLLFKNKIISQDDLKIFNDEVVFDIIFKNNLDYIEKKIRASDIQLGPDHNPENTDFEELIQSFSFQFFLGKFHSCLFFVPNLFDSLRVDTPVAHSA